MSFDTTDSSNYITTASPSARMPWVSGSGLTATLGMQSFSDLAAQLAGSGYGINAGSFGVVGDGTTDNSAALQAATTAALEFGLTVFLPVGMIKMGAAGWDLFDAANIPPAYSQKPLVFIGQAMNAWGQNMGNYGGTMLNITTTRTNGGVYAKMNGYFSFIFT
jgi:hypothetical protein